MVDPVARVWFGLMWFEKLPCPLLIRIANEIGAMYSTMLRRSITLWCFKKCFSTLYHLIAMAHSSKVTAQ